MLQEITKLSDAELTSALKALSWKENDATAEILKHLVELERRELHLRAGYATLFSFCVGALRYSEPAAGRRVTAARCIGNFPEVYELFKTKAVSLSSICVFSKVLTQENKADLLSAVQNKSTREVEAIAVSFGAPRKVVPERITPVRVLPQPELLPAAPAEAVKSTSESKGAPVISSTYQTFSLSSDVGVNRTVNSTPAPTELRYKISFMADEALMQKIKQLQDLIPELKTIQALVERLVEKELERRSPVRRQERRAARAKRAAPPVSEREAAVAMPEETVPEKIQPVKTAPESARRSRHIPGALRDSVSVRDAERCSYVAPDGTRCSCTKGLQVEQITPFSKGGGHCETNLKLLCRVHNLLAAQDYFGKDFMARFRKKSARGVSIL